MRYRLTITRRAAGDFQRIAAWSWARWPNASPEFLDDLEAAIYSLAIHPGKGEYYGVRYRRLLYRIFHIYYRVDEIDHTVNIIAIWHAARNPPKLQ